MLAAHDIAAILPYAIAAAIAIIVSIIAKLNSMGLFSAPLALASSSPSTSSSVRHAPRERKSHDPGDRFPGMVNLSGTLCYMNSVLQAFASLPTLTSYLERVINTAEAVDLPTPVCDALYEVLADLNTGHARHPPPLRPHVLLAALSPLPQIRRLLATREQQDAHELFVVLAEAVSDEAAKVAKEVARVRGGLSVALELRPNSLPPSAAVSRATSPAPSSAPSIPPRPYPPPKRNDALLVPWEGLLARRRICARCGYSDVVRMDTLGGMELPVPRSVSGRRPPFATRPSLGECIGRLFGARVLPIGVDAGAVALLELADLLARRCRP
jgi:ubiquitin carboxyl-terminal hydrolase 1